MLLGISKFRGLFARSVCLTSLIDHSVTRLPSGGYPLQRPQRTYPEQSLAKGNPRSPLFSARSNRSLRGFPFFRRRIFPPLIFRDNSRRAARPASHSPQVVTRGSGRGSGSVLIDFAFDFRNQTLQFLRHSVIGRRVVTLHGRE